MTLSDNTLFDLNGIWKEELKCRIHKRIGFSFITEPEPNSVTSGGFPEPLGNQAHKKMRCVLMCDDARLPTRATPGSAGLDIFAPHSFSLGPLQRLVIPTGLAIQPPRGHYLRLASRAAMASNGVDVVGGIVDPDFTGQIGVLLYNSNVSGRLVHDHTTGRAFAQAIVTPYLVQQPIQVTRLFPTERGARGFGKVTRDLQEAEDLEADIEDTITSLERMQARYKEVTTRRQRTKKLERVRFADQKLKACESCGMDEIGKCSLKIEKKEQKEVSTETLEVTAVVETKEVSTETQKGAADVVVEEIERLYPDLEAFAIAEPEVAADVVVEEIEKLYPDLEAIAIAEPVEKNPFVKKEVKCRVCPEDLIFDYRCLCINGGEPHHNDCCDSEKRIPGLRDIRDPRRRGKGYPLPITLESLTEAQKEVKELVELEDEGPDFWKEFDDLGNEIDEQETEEIWRAMVDKINRGHWDIEEKELIPERIKSALEIGKQMKGEFVERKVLRARRKQRRSDEESMELSG